MKNTRMLKASFQKSGSGSINARINIPITWIREIGITELERDVKLTKIDNKIIIEKSK